MRATCTDHLIQKNTWRGVQILKLLINGVFSIPLLLLHSWQSVSLGTSFNLCYPMNVTKCHTDIQQENYSSVSTFVNKNHSLCLFTFRASRINVILTCSTIQSIFLGTAVTCYWAGSRRLAEWNWKVVAVTNKSRAEVTFTQCGCFLHPPLNSLVCFTVDSTQQVGFHLQQPSVIGRSSDVT